MKTEVILERPFMGYIIRQKSKTSMFNATDLVKIANVKRRELELSSFNLSQFLKTKSTKEFIEELQKDNDRVIIKGRGAKSQTWVHPLLFIDIALAINPKFKIEVYKWLYDELLKYRNDSGDSYTKMAGILYERSSDKTRFHKFITNVAKYIKEKCKVDDWNKTSQEKLFLRDKIHENIYLLASCLKDPSYAVKMGVHKALEDNKDLLN
jgi:hypothetical protein